MPVIITNPQPNANVYPIFDVTGNSATGGAQVHGRIGAQDKARTVAAQSGAFTLHFTTNLPPGPYTLMVSDGSKVVYVPVNVVQPPPAPPPGNPVDYRIWNVGRQREAELDAAQQNPPPQVPSAPAGTQLP